MATTKSAAFSSKIRNLNEYYNNIVNCSLPVTNTGADIASTLKYFSQTLLSILKETNLDEDEINDTEKQNDENPVLNRIKKFPNLNYSTLYHSLLNFIEIIPTIQQSQIAVGQALLHTFGCLTPFLTDDLIESLPHTIALTLTTFPKELHKQIMEILCNTVIHISIMSNISQESFTLNSIPSIIMIVLEYGEDPGYHVQLFECLLSMKKNLIQDILCAISYGSYKVRYHATNLLFHYWPKLNPNKSDRNKHYHYSPRKPIQCQSEKCVERKNAATKVCVDPNYSMHGLNTPPPFYICNDCYRDIPKKFQNYCNNIVQPVEEISLYCENRNCKATDKISEVICYSSLCVNLNQNKPISLCKECHLSKHYRFQQKSDHIYQTYIYNIWECVPKTRSYLTSSITALLKEVPIIDTKKVEVISNETNKRFGGSISLPQGTQLTPGALSASTNLATGQKNDLTNLISVGLIGALNNNGHSNTGALATNLLQASTEESNFNKRLLSRYGCYLIVSTIKPNDVNVEDVETFGKIVSMVLEWFHLVCYMPSDSSGELISKIRTQFILPWIKSVIDNHFELVVACLLPIQPDFAKVGGVWETKSNKSTQIKEEFSKFCDLIPYEIVTFEVWDYAMPYWIETIINDVPEKHLNDFKTICSKVFDPDSFTFTPELMYRFISERFDGTSSNIQEQALSWLQILCELNVIIPASLLISMFHTGLSSLQKLEARAMRRREALMSSNIDFDQFNENILNNNAFFSVFDTYEAYRVYRNQLMLQQMTGQELAMLLKEEEEDFIINNSELNINCCIMMLDMVLKQFDLQKNPKHLGFFNPISKEMMSLMSKQLILPWAKKHKCKQQFGFLSAEAVSNQTSGQNGCQFCEEYVLWFSFAKEILTYMSPKNEIELNEINFGHLLEAVSAFKTLGIEDELKPNSLTSTPKKSESKTDPEVGIWVTSYGVYYFKFSQLSPHLQLLHSMLKELYRVPDVDAFYNLLICLKMLIIHGDCLELANKEQKGFLIYCLEKLLIPCLWRLFNADYCHLNDIAVPLLIHSLVYEAGRNTFRLLVERDFKESNWKTRLQAVSKSIAIAQNLKLKQIKSNSNVFSSLSFLFGNLIFTINDIDPIVSQKSITLIETLSDQAIKSILACFELQFDCIIQDRPLILKILAKFYSSFTNSLKPQSILTWDFFMNRFNSLHIEQQLVNDVISPTDITGVSANSQNFQKKINIAKFALKRTDHIKAISNDIQNIYTFNTNEKLTKEPKRKTSEEASVDQKQMDETIQEFEIFDQTKDNEYLDKKILHLLISLFMKFALHDDQTPINEDRVQQKQQNIVLKHLYTLIKFNQQDNIFIVSPNVLRKTTSVNAFMSGLSMLMDKNFSLGNILLPNVLKLLRYLPLPSIDENVSIRVSQVQAENSVPNYTIGLLNGQTRHAWINTFTIILYKYQYNSIVDNQNYPHIIKQLIRIVINTLKFQFHKCDITSLDPIHLFDLNVSSKKLTKDGSSQNSTTNTTNINQSENVAKGLNILYSSNRNVNLDDNLSIKSSEKSGKKLNQNLDYRKRFFNIKLRSKSNSSTLSNQTEQRNKLKEQKLKDLKCLSTSQTRLDSIVLQKGVNQKDSSAYETVLVDENSEDLKSCPFSFRQFFSNPKSHILGKKSSKTSQNIPMLNMAISDQMNVHRIGSSVLSTQGLHAVKLSQAGRRSAVTKCSNDDENTNESDSETIFLSNYDLIMNASELLCGEYGFSYIKCSRCDSRLEYYNEDSLGGLIVICSTFVHRESSLAAPLILDMLNAIMRIASKKMYSWQVNSNFYLPGNYTSIAKQFIRCLLHQLLSNKILYQLFQLDFDDAELLEVLAVSLNDFSELTSVAALKQVINDINMQKSINFDTCMRVLNNVSIYIEYLTLESQHSQWLLVIQELETLFRQLETIMNKSYDYTSFFVIMTNLLRVPGISTNKTIIEPFSKLLSFILQNSKFKLENLIEICSLSNRVFAKDRDRQFLPRVIINELVQSISVKVKCTDRNLLLILQLAVLDAGGNIYKSTIIEDENDLYDPYFYVPTNAADCLKQHLTEIISFIADIHSLTRIKQNLKSEKHLQTCPSEDSLGAQLKGGLAQFLALEFTELNKCKDKDSRSIQKYMPWLSNLPSNAQQGAKEFVDCIDHIRFLSWILIGSLTHSALTRNKGTVISYPIPINCGNYIGEHIFYILNGFAEHSKTSAIHMSSLFHSFILCQLWTMYCEQIHYTYDTENDSSALNSIMEFWTRITPGILQLLSQTKVLADMVILHFLSLIEGLQEYNSLVLAKFFPIWVQVFFMTPLQGDQLKRAKQCLNFQTSNEMQINSNANYNVLIKCLQRLQYKVAMIEMQSSNAAQLYNS